MVAIKILHNGKDKIVHFKNETNCKKWLSLFSDDFDLIEIRNMKTKSVKRLIGKYDLSEYIGG